MDYPRLKPRPMSVQACTSFRGLDRRPGASSKAYNKSWHWCWHDERNLSTDRWPRVAIRTSRASVNSIDGNELNSAIVAVCGGDHIILLDQNGLLWCNSYSVDISALITVTGARLIRMGANVLIYSDGRLEAWVDAIRLASGQSMVANTHYGLVNYSYAHSGLQQVTTISICNIDGEDFDDAVVSDSAPNDHDKAWLDTSSVDGTPVLRGWSPAIGGWIPVTTTYVKISPVPITNINGVSLKDGDCVHIKASYFPDFTSNFIKDILEDSYHQIVKTLPNDNAIVIIGILDDRSVTSTAHYTLTRDCPKMDYIVKAANRLWGCRYDEQNSINEIYASALGDFKNWDVFQGLATDSWRASRGTAAPFTGAIALGENPLFFREESLEKVYPSSSGGHQIVTYALDGVQKGSDGSMVIIDERLFYKSRKGVCVYAGTLPQHISDEFDDWIFSDASAGRHKRKYVCSMTRSDNVRLCMAYDLDTGDWHVEDDVWEGPCVTWNDELFYTVQTSDENANLMCYEGSSADGVAWFAESDDLSMELPEHKFVYYLRLRFRLDLGSECRVLLSYDDGPWLRKGTLHGNRLNSGEINIWPKRCDHFKLRIEGRGGAELQSISYRIERSEGGH